jgi:hypothetical protein
MASPIRATGAAAIVSAARAEVDVRLSSHRQHPAIPLLGNGNGAIGAPSPLGQLDSAPHRAQSWRSEPLGSVRVAASVMPSPQSSARTARAESGAHSTARGSGGSVAGSSQWSQSGRHAKLAAWDTPPAVLSHDRAFETRARAAELNLARRAAAREAIGFESMPHVLVGFDFEHPMLQIASSRARLQFCESPRKRLVEPVSISDAVAIVERSFPHRRGKAAAVFERTRRPYYGRPPGEPLAVPAVPAARKQRLGRTTVNRGLPRLYDQPLADLRHEGGGGGGGGGGGALATSQSAAALLAQAAHPGVGGHWYGSGLIPGEPCGVLGGGFGYGLRAQAPSSQPYVALMTRHR